MKKSYIAGLNVILLLAIIALLSVYWVQNRRPRFEDYLKAAEGASRALYDYYQEHGRLPRDASDLPDPSVMMYRGRRMVLDSTNWVVSLQVPGESMPRLRPEDAGRVAGHEVEKAIVRTHNERHGDPVWTTLSVPIRAHPVTSPDG